MYICLWHYVKTMVFFTDLLKQKCAYVCGLTITQHSLLTYAIKHTFYSTINNLFKQFKYSDVAKRHNRFVKNVILKINVFLACRITLT